MRLIQYVVLFCILTSCDPGLGIEIINTTNSKACVEWEFNRLRHVNHFSELSISDSVRIEINSKDTAHYFFGIGVWEGQGNLDSLVNMSEQIKVSTENSTTIYKGDLQIRKFLKEN